MLSFDSASNGLSLTSRFSATSRCDEGHPGSPCKPLRPKGQSLCGEEPPAQEIADCSGSRAGWDLSLCAQPLKDLKAENVSEVSRSQNRWRKGSEPRNQFPFLGAQCDLCGGR